MNLDRRTAQRWRAALGSLSARELRTRPPWPGGAAAFSFVGPRDDWL